MHRPVERLGQFLLRRLANGFDARAALAEHDGALARPAHIDGLVDAHAAIVELLPAGRLGRNVVGNLVMQAQEQLFPRDLGGEEAKRRIGEVVLGIEPGAFRQARREMVQQVVHAVAGQRRDHEDIAEAVRPEEPVGARQQPFAGEEVDLVERQHRLPAARLEAGDDFVLAGARPARGIDQQYGDVGVTGSAPGAAHHCPLEPAARLEDAGRVHEDDLGGAVDADAEHARARGLRLGRDNGNLGADQAVEQGGLAGIGRAQQGDETGPARGHSNRSSRAAAAAAAAARLDPPEPLALLPLASAASTSNSGRCAGPRLARTV